MYFISLVWISVFFAIITDCESLTKREINRDFHHYAIGPTVQPHQAHLYRYQVAFRETCSQNCGGTIISDRHILTAAHCVHRSDPRPMTIKAGVTYVEDPIKGQIRDVISIKIHRSFDPIENDVALLTLQDPLDLSDLAVAKLPKVNESFDGEMIEASGWGYTENLTYAYFTVKQNPNICYHPSKLCVENFPNMRIYTGDSGGPVVKRIGNDVVLVGIVSGKSGLQHVFANVAYLRPWIDEAILEGNQMIKMIDKLRPKLPNTKCLK